MIGKTIVDYEVTDSLGEGGFGKVYKAQSPQGEDCAIKVLNPDKLGNIEVLQKFFDESTILAKLDHPNITKQMRFFPYQDEDKINYAIAMEFVEGTDLSKIIKKQKGPLDLQFAKKIAGQALDALQFAFDQGVTHRDIKPANIMIDTNDDCKIMDFGIAKMSTAVTHDTAKTMFSPHYAAPERYDRSKTIDQRSDIYSLGTVFYEMFTGKRLCDASDTSQIMFFHINQLPEPPKTQTPSLPDDINQAILKALEKDPEDRFWDFKEFKKALLGTDEVSEARDDETKTHISDVPEIPKKEKKSKKLYIGGGIAFLFSCIIAVVLYIQPGIIGIEKGPPPPEPVPKPSNFESLGKNSRGFEEFNNPKDESIMILIPAGKFTMGSEKYPDQKPEQSIHLHSFFIDKYPVTNKQFTKFVEGKKHKTEAEERGYGYVLIGLYWEEVEGATWKMPNGDESIDGLENHPVTQVSYNDALAYCKWAQKDLPTEAQWEKAARGPDEGYQFPWGNTPPDSTTANFNNPEGVTNDVKKFEKGQSYYGVLDMAGNVEQWCKDRYAEGERQANNPTGPKEGTERVTKGGSFVSSIDCMRSSYRNRYEPDYSNFGLGFRCAGNY